MSAILVKGGRVIAKAVNSPQPARNFLSRLVSYPIGRHAECNLLHGLDREVTLGATIYVTGRVRKTKNRILSKPCYVCVWFASKM